jgi:hypothetical protein
VLGVHDRVVGADDRVDVLEEHDPRGDLMRPADVLRLLLVLSEVAGRVEELLRNDRRPELDLLEGVLATRRGRDRTAFEVLAHRVRAEVEDAVVAQLSDAAVVERDELHRQTVLATRA